MKRIVALFCLVFCSREILAQEEIGLNPPSLKWQQIATPAGRVIFPLGLDSLAYRAAGIMAHQKINDRSIVGTDKTKNIPTIIQNQSSMPAGFATPAPWRNEFYITPPQNLFTGPVPWFDYLTIHEYRHAQQFYMANKGFTLPFKVLMGQTGWLLHSLFNQPLWFREGDAVTSETLLTKAGRGRQPRFHMEYRALRLSGLHFNYEKANLSSSFKDFVPNPYRIGYYLTTKLRRDFGDTIWQKVLYDTYHKNPVYGFDRSLKRHTGFSTKTLYQAEVKELDSIFVKTDKNLKLTPAQIITKTKPKGYTNYRFPHYLPDGSKVVLKDAFNEIRTFYLVMPDGSEKKIFPYGIYTDDHVMFSGNEEMICWAESGFDERWVNQDYSIIKTYNLKSGKTRKITSRTRYFAPAPSPDGTKIAAVHSDRSGKNSLVILDARTGDLIKEFPSKDNAFLAQPRWFPDNEKVVAIAVNNQGNSLIQINTQTGESTFLLPFTTVPISRPVPFNDYIFYSAGYSGIDNIHALQTTTGRNYQVTSVRFGAYEPTVSFDGKKLLYSNYTAYGYELAETEIDPAKWNSMEAEPPTDLNFHEPLTKFSGNQDITDSTFRTNYKVTRYNQFTDGLFNIYGWFPTFGNNQYGAEFYTRNLMSTLRGTLGVFYNSNEGSFGTKVNVAYAALYPIIDLELGLQSRRKAKIRRENVVPEIKEQDWTEKYWLAGLRFPFRLTQGKYRTNLELGGAYGHYTVAADPDPELTVEPTKTNFASWRGILDFRHLLPQARQHVKPRWGQTVALNFQQAIDETPERFFANTAFLFPGFSKNHSFNVEGRWKKEAVQNTYRFTDNFIMPRGYKPDPFDKIWVISGNYELPVWYLDLALGRVAFFQRLRTNFFVDYSRAEIPNVNSNLNSAGSELFIDLRLLRLFSMSLGFRYSFVQNTVLAETVPFQFLVTRFELLN